MRKFLIESIIFPLASKERRRKRLIQAPFPEAWEEILSKRVPHFNELPPDDREKLRRRIQIFCAEKNFEGCDGLEITDEIRVVIAAQACLLILHKNSDYYPGVSSILVYPQSYKRPSRLFKDGWSGKDTVIQGESWSRDYVVLSWDDVLFGSCDPHDGSNLVFHEFAHQLDAEDGSFDGLPILRTPTVYRRWKEVFKREYQKLCDDAQSGQATLLNHYGAENPSEFFAVATETFFERPRELKLQHRRLYELLSVYYEQNPSRSGSARTLKISLRDWPLSPSAESVADVNEVIREGERELQLFLFGLVIFLFPTLVLMSWFPEHRLAALAVGVLMGAVSETLWDCFFVRRSKAQPVVITRRVRALKLELIEADPAYGLSSNFYNSQIRRLPQLGFRLLAQFRDARLTKTSGLAFESIYVSADFIFHLFISHYRPRGVRSLFGMGRLKGDCLYFLTRFNDGSELVTATDPSVSKLRPPSMRLSIVKKEIGVEAVFKAHQAATRLIEEEENLKAKPISTAAELLRFERIRHRRLQRFRREASGQRS